MPLITGAFKDYEWLETEHEFETVVTLCPGIALRKYLAITSVDCGVFHAVAQSKVPGWECEGGISYSPRVEAIESLPSDCFLAFSEWYIYDAVTRQGTLCSGNPFETEMVPPNVFAFVNFVGFRPSDDGVGPLFWRQLEWMRPASYISEGYDRLIFVSRDQALFSSVREKLERVPVDEP